ncbi:MAG TPA: hypothetical protein VHX49_09270 [Candidatus Acidoferrales bacterium]|jgi:hypothetical protein|nr:hypothetical protein [Candidatus Acidoferrales bacterium]
MKACEVFDTCYTRYRGLREWVKDSSSAVRAVNLDMPSSGYQWRPDRARACEYVADFERIGRRALSRPEWKGRLKLFQTYFVRGADYRQAVRLVGVSEGTFDYWFGEVKRAVGREFSRTGLFPPSRYFDSRGLSTAERSILVPVVVARFSEEFAQQRDSEIQGNGQQILEQR